MPGVIALFAALVLTAPAAAQEVRALTVRGALKEEAPAPLEIGAAGDLDAGTAARMGGAGILGGAVGLFGGAYLGAWIGDTQGDGIDDLDSVVGALIGAAIGESTLLPLGVHVANRGRGSYWKSTLVSVGLAAGGVGLLEAAHWDAPAVPIIAVAVPLAQLGAAIAIERATD